MKRARWVAVLLLVLAAGCGGGAPPTTPTTPRPPGGGPDGGVLVQRQGPAAGCAGGNAKAMFLADDVPYLIDKAERSTLYRFPRLDRGRP